MDPGNRRPSFKATVSAITRSRQVNTPPANTKPGKITNANPVKGATPRGRVPLAPIKVSSNQETRYNATKNTPPTVNAERKRVSVTSSISNFVSNAIRRSPTRRECLPVRDAGGNFMPPMHLAQRKGSKYAPSSGRQSQKNVEKENKPPVRARVLHTVNERPATVEATSVFKLKPLNLVNKVLSSSQPVANLVPTGQATQKVVEDRLTGELKVITEVRVCRMTFLSSITTADTFQVAQLDTQRQGRGIRPGSRVSNYPLQRRSMGYKPTDPATRAPKLSYSPNFRSHTTGLQKRSTGELECQKPAIQRVHRKESSDIKPILRTPTKDKDTIRSRVATSFVKTAVNSPESLSVKARQRTPSTSSATTSQCSTPTPSPTKPRASLLELRPKIAEMPMKITNKASAETGQNRATRASPAESVELRTSSFQDLEGGRPNEDLSTDSDKKVRRCMLAPVVLVAGRADLQSRDQSNKATLGAARTSVEDVGEREMSVIGGGRYGELSNVVTAMKRGVDERPYSRIWKLQQWGKHYCFPSFVASQGRLRDRTILHSTRKGKVPPSTVPIANTLSVAYLDDHAAISIFFPFSSTLTDTKHIRTPTIHPFTSRQQNRRESCNPTRT